MRNFAKKLLSLCKKSTNIAIMGHKSPDFDSIGSCIAMKRILQKFDIPSDIFVEKPLNDNFNYLVKDTEFLVEKQKDYDLCIVVDCSDISSSLIPLNTATSIVKIDHHISGKDCLFGDLNFVDYNASSTCEVIYYLFHNLVEFDVEIASAIFMGIYTDTGGFKFSNTSTRTFSALAKLSRFDFERDKLIYNCLSIIKYDEFLLTQVAFASIKFFQNNQIAVSAIRYDDFVNNNCNPDSHKFMPSYLPNIEGVKISISITEKKKNEYNISLRTAMDDVDVSNIAVRFNGGGHIRASGLTLRGDYNKALNALLLECKKELNK